MTAAVLAVPGWGSVLRHDLSILTYYNDALCSTSTLWSCSDTWDSSYVTESWNTNNVASVTAVTGAEVLGGSANGDLAYSLAVDGPGATATVDIDAVLQTGINPVNGAEGSASIEVDQGSLQYYYKQVIGGSYSGTVSLALPVGAYTVWLTAGAGTGSDGGTYAYADPHIYIDPTFAATNPGFSIDTDGVGNQTGSFSPAPEPGSWMLLGGAVAAIAAVRRRLPLKVVGV